MNNVAKVRFTMIALSLSVVALQISPANAITASPGVNLAQLVATVNALKAQQAADEATINGQATQIAALTSANTALQAKTAPISVSGTDLTITGMNVHIVSGSGSTSDGTFNQLGKPVQGTSLTGLGNLIIGYNALRNDLSDARLGSHNLILGDQNSYSSFGGILAGKRNTISAEYAGITGGYSNVADGIFSQVSGGYTNSSDGPYTSIAGGSTNIANAFAAEVAGGYQNRAYGSASAVSGGRSNSSEAEYASVSGGYDNVAAGTYSSVTGGSNNAANIRFSTVSGGAGVTENNDYGWAAGSETETPVSGNFSSP